MPIDKTLLERIASRDPTLLELDLSYQQLTAADFQILQISLGQNPYVRTVDISGNAIDLEYAEVLANIPQLTSLIAAHCQIDSASIQVLAQSPTIISLVLTDNKIGAKGAQILARHNTVTYLDLTMNQVRDEGAIALASNPTLTSLFLGRNQITAKGASALAKNDRLRVLNLNYNKIEAEGIAAFRDNTSLESLSIAGNASGNLGIVALANNQMLTSLDASYNNLTDEAVVALANHPRLRYLNLSFNNIGFKGAAVLGNNQTLNTLLLNYNQLGDGGAITLARHRALQSLELTGNKIGFEGAHALAHNTNLTSLTLNSNLLGDAGAITLAHNTTLNELLLAYNQISDSGAIVLAENTTLRLLNLSYNHISEKGREALVQAKTISSLIFSPEQPPEFTTENLDTIFLLSDSFFCICSLDGIIQFFNPSFSRVLGYRSDELFGKRFVDLLHPIDLQQAKQLSQEEQLISTMLDSEQRYRCKDRSYRLIHWSSRTLHQHRYAIGTDITEKKQFELELIKSQEKIIWLELQEAQGFSHQQTEFIAQLSHEVRNPLSSAYGLMEIIQGQVDTIQTVINDFQYNIPLVANEILIRKSEEIKDNLTQVFTCLDYQKTILDDNLDLVRITDKKLILKKDPFDLIQVIHEVIDMLQPKAAQKELTINYKLPETLLLKGDSTRMKQIFVNLVGNAIKFTAQGHIDIVVTIEEVTHYSTCIKIEISDTGMGLTSEESGQLFQRFSQVVGNEYGGSGLGLYIIKQLTQLMGGEISVASEKEVGSTFSILLTFENLTKEEQQQFQQKTQIISASVLVEPMFSLAKLRILIVDDNALNRKILGAFFTKTPGCTCEFANDGQEAVDAYDTQAFDIILMDMMMPVMDGITATQEIRKREKSKRLSRIPIIAVTANALERDRTEALRAGVDACIIKPFKKEEIFKKIVELIQNIKVEPVPALSATKITSDSPLMHTPVKSAGDSGSNRLTIPIAPEDTSYAKFRC